MTTTVQQPQAQAQDEASGKLVGTALRVLQHQGVSPAVRDATFGHLFALIAFGDPNSGIEGLRVPGREGEIIENHSVKETCLENGALALAASSFGDGDIISSLELLFETFLSTIVYETHVEKDLKVRLRNESTS